MMRVVCLVLSALLVSCASEPITTTERRCAYGEDELEIAAPRVALDAVIIVSPTLAPSVRTRIAALIAALATSDLDGDGRRDVYQNDELRLSIVSPAQAIEHLRAPDDAPLRFVAHDYAPYGYPDDVDAFVERALCMLSSEPHTCQTEPAPGDYGIGRLFGFARVFIVSDLDACAPDEPSSTSARSCDPQLTDLMAAIEEHAQYDPSWDLALIAPLPAPELVRLADTTRVLDVSADDYREIIASYDCNLPYNDWFFDLDSEVDPRTDGSYDCTLYEVLPAQGPITQCQQLAGLGRELAPIERDDGREVCELRQILETEAESAFGWFVPTDAHPFDTWQGHPKGAPWCARSRYSWRSTPQLTPTTEAIPGAELRLRCYDAIDTSLPSCTGR